MVLLDYNIRSIDENVFLIFLALLPNGGRALFIIDITAPKTYEKNKEILATSLSQSYTRINSRIQTDCI